MNTTVAAVPAFLFATMAAAEAPASLSAEPATAYAAIEACHPAYVADWKLPALPISVSNITLSSDRYVSLFGRALGLNESLTVGAARLAYSSLKVPEGFDGLGYDGSADLAATVGTRTLFAAGALLIFGILYLALMYRRDAAENKSKSTLADQAYALAQRKKGNAGVSGTHVLSKPENLILVGGEKKPSLPPRVTEDHTYGKRGIN